MTTTQDQFKDLLEKFDDACELVLNIVASEKANKAKTIKRWVDGGLFNQGNATLQYERVMSPFLRLQCYRPEGPTSLKTLSYDARDTETTLFNLRMCFVEALRHNVEVGVDDTVVIGDLIEMKKQFVSSVVKYEQLIGTVRREFPQADLTSWGMIPPLDHYRFIET